MGQVCPRMPFCLPFIVHQTISGSFGHFQAHHYRLQSGGEAENWRLGLTKTRESVLKLNQYILQEHSRRDLPCVSISPFPTVMMSEKKFISAGALDSFSHLIEQGLIPLTHGDVVLDPIKKCVICSGDHLLEW
jgi:isopentenyl phosphate kinase